MPQEYHLIVSRDNTNGSAYKAGAACKICKQVFGPDVTIFMSKTPGLNDHRLESCRHLGCMRSGVARNARDAGCQRVDQLDGYDALSDARKREVKNELVPDWFDATESDAEEDDAQQQQLQQGGAVGQPIVLSSSDEDQPLGDSPPRGNVGQTPAAKRPRDNLGEASSSGQSGKATVRPSEKHRAGPSRDSDDSDDWELAN
jgi:hypothetical protein